MSAHCLQVMLPPVAFRNALGRKVPAESNSPDRSTRGDINGGIEGSSQPAGLSQSTRAEECGYGAHSGNSSGRRAGPYSDCPLDRDSSRPAFLGPVPPAPILPGPGLLTLFRAAVRLLL